MTGMALMLLLGISLLGGAVGASVFQKLRIPQVVGYIAIGLLLGQTGFNFIHTEHITMLKPLNMFALGIIGFLVGGELQIETFKKYASQFIAILIGEGMAAFILVGLSSFAIMYFVLDGDVAAAAAAAVVFGAIASATDPASTIDVLWEYRARGVLTTSITAIVALDDALAMTLYGLGSGAAQLLAGASGEEVSLMEKLWDIGVELIGAILAGIAAYFILRILLKWLSQQEKTLALAIGLILLLIGVSFEWHMDTILATMTLGFCLVNFSPRRSEHVFSIMRGFSTPIYVLFFVLVGARLTLSGMPMWLWGIVAAYVICRNGGKMLGAWLGAKITHAEPNVCNYLGMGLFAQGGVAVGLSIMAGSHLANISVGDGLSLGDAIIFAVTATTLIVQVSGPPLVRLAIIRSGEAGRNITDEDVLKQSKVEQFMLKDIQPFNEGMTLNQAVGAFARNNLEVAPVTDDSGKLLGTISLKGMRNILADREAWQWLLVSDVLESAEDITSAESPLSEAVDYMRQLHLQQIPVVENIGSDKPVGILDLNLVSRRVSDEVIRRQNALPEIAGT